MIKRPSYMEKLQSIKEKQIIKVITGLRRSGKSIILEMFAEKLIADGVDESQIIFINFEDKLYEKLDNSDALYSYLINKLVKNKFTYIFLDEIQNVKNFEKCVDSLFIKKNVDLYITGSNAKILSGELATLLAGRYIEIEVFPLSFAEYIGEEKYDLERKFRNYLRFGSLPYIMQLNNDEALIHQYLRGIFETVIIKDVMERNKIKEEMLLRSLVKFLFNNIGGTISTKKIVDTLTTAGRKTNSHTIENYLIALEKSFIIHEATRYDIKGKEYLKTLSKYYIADIGLRNMLLGYRDIDMGHILENIIYLELKRRGYEIGIGKIGENEVDFIAFNQYEKLYIQVAENTRDANVLKRELAPFDKINDHYTKMLITNDFDLNTSYNGIKRVHILDFLINE